jgi:hypothetical protein
MRTHGDLYAAWRVRTAPLSSLAVEIVPAKRGRGKSVAREAVPLFGQPGPNTGVGCTAATVESIIGDLANHAVAIGFNSWSARPDGSRHDIEHKPWPLEFVWYDESDDQLYTSIDAATSQDDRAALAGELGERATRRGRVPDLFRIPVNHGDGRWAVYRLSDLLPWRNQACLLPGALTWAAAAYSDRDWNRGSTTHGNTKPVGWMPEHISIQRPVLDDDGKPTGDVELSEEAQALLDLLEDIASLDRPYGIAPFGTKIDLLANPSNMWQVWKELGARAERLAYLIYTGTTAGLGVQTEGPGVNVEQLMDVGLPIVQGDKAAFEIGFHEGVMVPWTAVNHGDSSLAPQRLYQLPDTDAQQNREHTATNEEAFTRAYEGRKAAGILTQAWANEYADRLGVARVQVPPEHLVAELPGDAAPASGVRPAA